MMLDQIRPQTYTGRPLGTQPFAAKPEKLPGRIPQALPKGMPRKENVSENEK